MTLSYLGIIIRILALAYCLWIYDQAAAPLFVGYSAGAFLIAFWMAIEWIARAVIVNILQKYRNNKQYEKIDRAYLNNCFESQQRYLYGMDIKSSAQSAPRPINKSNMQSKNRRRYELIKNSFGMGDKK